jgi:CheY-like chemotaxis protein
MLIQHKIQAGFAVALLAGGGVFLRVMVVLVIFTGHSFAQTQGTNSSSSALKKMSLEELMDMDVTSVAKQPEPYGQAPAAIQVVTGYDEEPYRTRCLAAGADHFFSKNRQHRALIQELHNLGGDAPAATGRPADASPSDSADF